MASHFAGISQTEINGGLHSLWKMSLLNVGNGYFARQVLHGVLQSSFLGCGGSAGGCSGAMGCV